MEAPGATAELDSQRTREARSEVGLDAAGEPNPQIDRSPGSWVAHFRIKRLLGEGGMGRVYLARDTVLGRAVALKMIRLELVGHRGVERFIEEARTTARFSHPNIVIVHAAGEHEGRPYLALEYLDGT